ncbi:MAG TPA: copper chaperone PCu(A)C [Gammaproteobacteria bacterium]
MTLNRTYIAVFIALVLGFLMGKVSAHTDGGVVVKDAWVREAPPNAKVLAAYMTIENHTAQQKVLTGVSSSAFGAIEIHKTVQKDGMASMAPQKELTIAAENSVQLEPGGLHLMLFNPGTPLKAGDSVTFTLKFANGGTSIVSAKVQKAQAGDDHHHHSTHDEHKTQTQPESENSQHHNHQH